MAASHRTRERYLQWGFGRYDRWFSTDRARAKKDQEDFQQKHESGYYEKIPRQDRIALACSFYGLYMFGLAVTESERVDEDCAMNNARVPWCVGMLTEAHEKYLDELRASDRFSFEEVTKGPTVPTLEELNNDLKNIESRLERLDLSEKKQ
jgi:hypothetical protein